MVATERRLLLASMPRSSLSFLLHSPCKACIFLFFFLSSFCLPHNLRTWIFYSLFGRYCTARKNGALIFPKVANESRKLHITKGNLVCGFETKIFRKIKLWNWVRERGEAKERNVRECYYKEKKANLSVSAEPIRSRGPFTVCEVHTLLRTRRCNWAGEEKMKKVTSRSSYKDAKVNVYLSSTRWKNKTKLEFRLQCTTLDSLEVDT